MTIEETRQDIVIACCRLLYGRLLAGRVTDKERDTVRRELSDRIREGLWPTYESDEACIRLLVRELACE